MYDSGGMAQWGKSELVLFCCEATMAVTVRTDFSTSVCFPLLRTPCVSCGSPADLSTCPLWGQERQMQQLSSEGLEAVDGNGTPYRELSAMMADVVLIKVHTHTYGSRWASSC
jgi:hypothetical protein